MIGAFKNAFVVCLRGYKQLNDNVLRIYESKLKKYKGIELPESMLQMLFDEAKTEAYTDISNLTLC